MMLSHLIKLQTNNSFGNLPPIHCLYRCVCHLYYLSYDMEDQQHLHPLLTKSTITAITITPASNLDFLVSLPSDEILGTKEMGSSNSTTRMILLRLLSVVLIGFISLWASKEAKKGFQVTIQNDAHDNSPAGHRFQLLYVSNDRAVKLALEASQFVEGLLYPPPFDSTTATSQTYRKKQVNHVTLRLACQNLTQLVTIDSHSYEEGKFVINLSPSIMEDANVKGAMLRAVAQGIAWVWIFDNCNNAPSSLINGLVEYISSSLAPIPAKVDLNFGPDKSGHHHICWKDENPNAVAHFLGYCEEHRKGFIQRLNQAMSQTSNWHDLALDNALGMPAHILCSSYMSGELLVSNSLDSSSDNMM